MHLGDPVWAGELGAVLARSRAAGVDGWCAVATEPDGFDEVAAVARTVGARLALGLHPWFVDRMPVRDALDAVERLCPDALGEIGLDRLWPGFEDRQVAVAREQLAHARERGLPVVLHCVRAHAELLAVLREVGVPEAGGLVHGWTADAPALVPFLALGLHVSFGPAVLDSSRALRAAAAVPADRLLLESDGPGGGREPSQIPVLAARIALARGEEPDAVRLRAGASARRLFGAVTPA